MNGMKSVEQLINESARAFYTNEDVSPLAFSQLSATEKKEVAATLAICEFLNYSKNSETVKEVANPSGNDTVNGESYHPAASLSVAYFNKVLASKGDIKKTPNYTNNRALLSYARSVVHAAKATPESDAFMKKLTEFELALTNLEKYAPDFGKVIEQENKDYPDEKKRILTQFFTNLVVAVDVGIDVLYSSSIKANIDYSRNPAFVASVYFECKKDFMDEHITLVHYFNSLATTGKLRNILTSGATATLLDAKSRILKEENIIDVVFTILTSNKWTELLLLPLYLIRGVVYLVKYMSATYQKITSSVAESIAMIRKQTVTEEEFKSYKKQADSKALMFEQASKKAAIDISDSAKDNRDAIKELNSSVSASVMI